MNQKQINDNFLRQFPYEPTEGQKTLIARLSGFLLSTSDRPVFVLRGYAGTGKTTIVSALVKILPAMAKRSVLLAPTGRAAKVLSGYSGKRAYTIHKKIYRPQSSSDGSVHLSVMPNPHSDTLFIIDEASMIPDFTSPADGSFFSGKSLLDDLFHYVFSNENNFLLFLGDTAQLPPVGSLNSPALDPAYLKSNFHTDGDSFELTEVMRQAEESGILSNATRIRQKIGEEKPQPPFFRLQNYQDIVQLPPQELEELLNTHFSRDNLENTVVVTRSNKRANLFNQGIRNRILFREDEIGAGDYLMVVRNNYFWLPAESTAGFIANGDIVEVLRIKKRTELYGFRFAEALIRLIDYPEETDLEVILLLDTLTSEAASLSFADHNKFFQEVMADYMEIPNKRHRLEKVRNNKYYNALQVKFAYALTCHKTQGGQWENVIVDQGYLTEDMVNIEYLRWLYTAVTRATTRLYLLNFKEEFFE
ncbi:MAG: AAA family ATPase [Bacteroidetes bacterium]|nr:AAA family ATPase [Bacteroidota bacterium]